MAFTLDEMFGFNSGNFATISESGEGNKDLWIPRLEDAPDGEYKAIIRFIGNMRDKDLSLIKKKQYKITNHFDGTSVVVDCPKTLNDKAPSALADAYFALYNKGQEGKDAAKKAFNWFESTYSYIQIVDDPQHPELNGSIKIFRFGKTISDKLIHALKILKSYREGTLSDSDMTEDIYDPYSIVDGNIFVFKMNKRDRFQSYIDSRFISKKIAVKVGDEYAENKKEWVEKLNTWFDENAPDISKYKYKEWDEETKAIVAEAIKRAIPESIIVQKIFKQHNLQDSLRSVSESPTISTTTGISKNTAVDYSEHLKTNTSTNVDILDDLDTGLTNDDMDDDAELQQLMNAVDDDDSEFDIESLLNS